MALPAVPVILGFITRYGLKKAVQKYGQKAVKAAQEGKKLAATTTRIGVKKGRRTGEALRDKKGRVSGISKKTIEMGSKIRRGAGTASILAEKTEGAKKRKAQQKQKQKTNKLTADARERRRRMKEKGFPFKGK